MVYCLYKQNNRGSRINVFCCPHGHFSCVSTTLPSHRPRVRRPRSGPEVGTGASHSARLVRTAAPHPSRAGLLQMRAACSGGWPGNVRGIRKYSFIARRPQDRACAELVAVVVGRGLSALCLKPHQSPGPCVMRSGRAEEGSPLDSEEPPPRCRTGTGGQ